MGCPAESQYLTYVISKLITNTEGLRVPSVFSEILQWRGFP